jgi:uncharacterized protein (TIGR02421 family)
LRVLELVRWDDTRADAFLRQPEQMPAITPAYYAQRPLDFHPAFVQAELSALEHAVHAGLGATDLVGQLLRRRIDEYRLVVDLLDQRGTPAFARTSQRLYGTATAVAPELFALLDRLQTECRPSTDPQRWEAPAAADWLGARLAAYFAPRPVRVRLTDDLQADAAACGGTLKIRRAATFTLADLRLLEVHEGWVHLATTLNGLAQYLCPFLSKCPPSATCTQEGLAVLTECLAGVCHPLRLRRLRLRLQGLVAAEAGATFMDVIRLYRTAGEPLADSYQLAARLFRGSLPTAGPFAKDVCYLTGLLQVGKTVLATPAAERAQMVELLFAGKVATADVDALQALRTDETVQAARFVPTVWTTPTLAARLAGWLTSARAPVSALAAGVPHLAGTASAVIRQYP